MQRHTFTGGTAASDGYIGTLPPVPVVLFNRNEIVRYEIKVDGEWDLSVNPRVRFQCFSTVLPVVTFETVAWQLRVKYIAIGESASIAIAETLNTTRVFTLAANTRQGELFFDLDRTLIADGDLIVMALERMNTAQGDTYPTGSEVGIEREAIMQIRGQWGTL